MLWIVAQDIEVVVGGVLAAASSQIVAINNHVQLANLHHGWRFNLARALTPVAGLSAAVIGLYLLEPSAETLFLCLGLGLISSVASLWLTSEAHHVFRDSGVPSGGSHGGVAHPSDVDRVQRRHSPGVGFRLERRCRLVWRGRAARGW